MRECKVCGKRSLNPISILMKTIKLKPTENVPANYTGKVLKPPYYEAFYLNSKFHCTTGPAFLPQAGAKSYWLLGSSIKDRYTILIILDNAITTW